MKLDKFLDKIFKPLDLLSTFITNNNLSENQLCYYHSLAPHEKAYVAHCSGGIEKIKIWVNSFSDSILSKKLNEVIDNMVHTKENILKEVEFTFEKASIRIKYDPKEAVFIDILELTHDKPDSIIEMLLNISKRFGKQLRLLNFKGSKPLMKRLKKEMKREKHDFIQYKNHNKIPVKKTLSFESQCEPSKLSDIVDGEVHVDKSLTNKIDMYVKEGCPYCKGAKEYFESKNLGKYLTLHEQNELLQNKQHLEIATTLKHTTWPLIFIDDVFIGGFDNLKSMYYDSVFPIENLFGSDYPALPPEKFKDKFIEKNGIKYQSEEHNDGYKWVEVENESTFDFESHLFEKDFQKSEMKSYNFNVHIDKTSLIQKSQLFNF